MSLSKVPFLCAATWAAYVAITPPNPPAAQHERPKSLPASERIFSSWAVILSQGQKVLMSLGGGLEIVVLLARTYPSHPLSQAILRTLVWSPPSLAANIKFSPMFLVGCGLATLGGFIRYQCYRVLGQLFTYEVSIRDRHQLVTGGPYAYVRHPSYPSALAVFVGMGLCCTSPGSWFRECGPMSTIGGKVGLAVYSTVALYMAVTFVRRTSHEDALLQKEFGEKWEEWARKVPYRMIPYIY